MRKELIDLIKTSRSSININRSPVNIVNEKIEKNIYYKFEKTKKKNDKELTGIINDYYSHIIKNYIPLLQKKFLLLTGKALDLNDEFFNEYENLFDKYNPATSKIKDYKKTLASLNKDLLRKVRDDYYHIFNQECINVDQCCYNFDNIDHITMDIVGSNKIKALKAINDYDKLSIKYQNNQGDWITPIRNTLEYKEILEDCGNGLINDVLKGHNNIAKEMKTLLLYSNFEFLEEFIEVSEDILELKHVLKNKKINIIKEIKESGSIDNLKDKIDLIKRKNQVEKYGRSIVSNKYKHLIEPNDISEAEDLTGLDKKVYELFSELVEIKVDQRELQDLIGKKLAKFNKKEDLIDALSSVINSYSGFEYDKIIEKSKDYNTEKIAFEDNVLYLKIKNYEASKNLGSSSWCITTSENLFKHYTSERNCEQIFVFDFKRASNDIKSMIGITIDKKTKEYNTAHYKNDNYAEKMDLEYHLNNISNVLKNNKHKKLSL